jgi:hypothetical protein
VASPDTGAVQPCVLPLWALQLAKGESQLRFEAFEALFVGRKAPLEDRRQEHLVAPSSQRCNPSQLKQRERMRQASIGCRSQRLPPMALPGRRWIPAPWTLRSAQRCLPPTHASTRPRVDAARAQMKVAGQFFTEPTAMIYMSDARAPGEADEAGSRGLFCRRVVKCRTAESHPTRRLAKGALRCGRTHLAVLVFIYL